MCPPLEELGYQRYHKSVGYESDDDSDWNRNEAEDDRDCPECALVIALFRDRESRTANKDDQYLPATHNAANPYEEPVLEQAFKDIELVIQTSIATHTLIAAMVPEEWVLNLLPLVEDLHPDKCIEHQGVDLLVASRVAITEG